MQLCSSSKTPIVKGNRFFKGKCPHNDIERDWMKAMSYSSIVAYLILGNLLLSMCWVGT